MPRPTLAEQLDLFDGSLPLAQASAPPAAWYTSSTFFEAELQSVFHWHWITAARTAQLQEPGDYVAARFGRLPYVVLLNAQQQPAAFVNVCRHRAAEVACGSGTADQLKCTYHGWSYGLDGRLRQAPGLGAVEAFDRNRLGLVPLPVATLGPLVFVAPSEPAYTPVDDLAELSARLSAREWEKLRFVERRVYELACNWKVFVDNYLDGGYHVALLHRGLAGQLSLDSYRFEQFERYSIQTCQAESDKKQPSAPTSGGTTDKVDRGDFAARVAGGALYAWVYPNLMINRYGPMMDTNIVVPVGEGHCQVIFDWYFDEHIAGDRDFTEESIAASDIVQQEDVAICQSVQRGLASGRYRPGPYSVKRQQGEYHFHRMLSADIARLL